MKKYPAFSPYAGIGGRPWFDVTRYGARGDGSTNDAAAIQAAIDAANAAGGGVVRLPQPAVNYLLGSTTLLLYSDIILEGAGQDVILKYTGSASAIENATKNATAIYRGTVRDLSIVGDSQVAGSVGLDLRRVGGFSFERLYINNFDIGVKFDGTGEGYRNRMWGCNVSGNNTGIRVVSAANEQAIVGCIINNNDDYGVDIQDGNSISLLANCYETNGVHVKTASSCTRVIGGRMENATTYRWQTTSAAEYFLIEHVIMDAAAGQAYSDAGKFSNIKDIDRAGARGVNLVRNGGFEVWNTSTSAAPDRWTLSNCTVARNTDMQEGSYSALLTNGNTSGIMYQDWSIPTGLRDGLREYLFMGWVKLGTSTGAALQALPQDNGGSTQGSTLLPTRQTASSGLGPVTAAGWQFTYLVVRPNSSATRIRFGCNADTVVGTGTAYFDGLVLMPLAGPNKEWYPPVDDKAVGVSQVISRTVTFDFGNTSGNAVTDLTATVPGAADGDGVLIAPPNASVPTAGCFFGWVSAADTVTARFVNNSGTARDPGSGTYTIFVFKR